MDLPFSKTPKKTFVLAFFFVFFFFVFFVCLFFIKFSVSFFFWLGEGQVW